MNDTVFAGFIGSADSYINRLGVLTYKKIKRHSITNVFYKNIDLIDVDKINNYDDKNISNLISNSLTKSGSKHKIVQSSFNNLSLGNDR